MVKSHKTVTRIYTLDSGGALSHLMREMGVNLIVSLFQAIDEHSVCQLPFLYNTI